MVLFIVGCTDKRPPDGSFVENQILAGYDLAKDYSDAPLLQKLIEDINCADSAILGKRMVLAQEFHSWDTTEILLIPFISNGQTLKSSAYSDIANRYILINPGYIRLFALQNTINDTTAYVPVIELMLLHELGHFILNKPGAFDRITDSSQSKIGEQQSASQPEFLTEIKKTELSADSIAIALAKKRLEDKDRNCLDIAFDLEILVPGMQFQLAGRRIIDNFGSRDINFLHDPSNDHPNLELRVTFMNYFLFPNDSLKQMIDDYLYNRTVAPVHRQEFDPIIYQGSDKRLPEEK